MAELIAEEIKVFVSAAREDHELAARIGRALCSAGMGVWHDRASLKGGENWEDAILEAIRTSDALVFVVPRREGEGTFALQEAGAARALGKPIIAVIADPMRYGNGAIGRSLSGKPLIDASALSDAELGQALRSALR
jgi:hypothetical protein